jgi:outer membrane protein assembly factor BamB
MSVLSRKSGRRRAALRPALLAMLATLAVGGLVLGGRWLWTRQSLSWQVRRGLDLLSRAEPSGDFRAALDRWEADTGHAWHDRREDLVTLMVTHYPLEDYRTRLLLARVAGADFGADRPQWERWYKNRRRALVGLPPEVGRREAVALRERWTAAVGLTGWFSTILPRDGQIYVASLGADFGDGQDEADGVVRVSGATGDVDFLFRPEHRGPRDVIGLAATHDDLVVACANGTVYCLNFSGEVRWSAHAGDPILAPPLAYDLDRDGVEDVAVVTRGGKVVALSGRGGKVLWVAAAGKIPPGDTLLGAGLALGDIVRGPEQELLVTLPTGAVTVLSRTGKELWRYELETGSLAGGVCRATEPTRGAPAYVGDRLAAVWAIQQGERKPEATRWQTLGLRSDETLVAGLRTLGNSGAPTGVDVGPPWVIASVAGAYGSRIGAVCALTTDGLRWRAPVGGAIWGTPAIADLNGDRMSELIVTSIEPHPDGGARGVLSILSAQGQLLARREFDAPIECSPVVADVDGDNRLEILVADQDGWLHCLATNGFGPVEWGLFGGDSHNTRNAENAYAYGQLTCGNQAAWTPERTR